MYSFFFEINSNENDKKKMKSEGGSERKKKKKKFYPLSSSSPLLSDPAGPDPPRPLPRRDPLVPPLTAAVDRHRR